MLAIYLCMSLALNGARGGLIVLAVCRLRARLSPAAIHVQHNIGLHG